MSRTAIYPGTFDPLTNGHCEVIYRACKMFDRVIVAIADNPEKYPLFSLDERVDLVKQVLRKSDGIEIQGFSGLLIDFAQECQAQIIIRGLRAVSDFEYEFQLASMNRKLAKSIETVFLTPSEQNTFVSASLVKEIAKYGGDISPFVDSAVLRAVINKFS
ncbi:MAG: pantetheine-phosphate adenylyltransferase [Gammaproteobacteria bacterium]|nr:pantetheine-phosphate adenylyltransferase [Gammaproteobacteria bacterium]MCY4218901.1 pantetheine-phosphate adenylyltransferase [Gammaproteobacteria bacterium]MCY4276057.1 pantetheine-phosphate adenylyltransferase [Gammaproteobacteria bacterium]